MYNLDCGNVKPVKGFCQFVEKRIKPVFPPFNFKYECAWVHWVLGFVGLLGLFGFVGLKGLNDFSRIAGDNTIGWNIFGYYRAETYYGIVSNIYAF